MNNNIFDPGSVTPPPAQAPVMPTQAPVMPAQQPEKKGGAGKIIVIVLIIVLILVVLPIAAIFFFASSIVNTVTTNLNNSDKFVCDAKGSSMTIYYSGYSINGYSKSGSYFKYEMEDIEEKAEKSGQPIETWLIDFGQNLVKNSDGEVSCKINDEDVTTIDAEERAASIDTDQVIGNKETGYVTIPASWHVVHLLGSYPSRAVSYADDNYKIVLDDKDYSGYNDASEAAANYYQYIDSDSDYSDIESETVMIGQGKRIKARRISYKDDSFKKYYLYYIFESDSGVHSIKLEGDSDIEKYESIAESYVEKNEQ